MFIEFQCGSEDILYFIKNFDFENSTEYKIYELTANKNILGVKGFIYFCFRLFWGIGLIRHKWIYFISFTFDFLLLRIIHGNVFYMLYEY